MSANRSSGCVIVGDKLLLVIASFLTNFESDCVNGDEVMIKIRNLIKNLCAGEIFDDWKIS